MAMRSKATTAAAAIVATGSYIYRFTYWPFCDPHHNRPADRALRLLAAHPRPSSCDARRRLRRWKLILTDTDYRQPASPAQHTATDRTPTSVVRRQHTGEHIRARIARSDVDEPACRSSGHRGDVGQQPEAALLVAAGRQTGIGQWR